MKTTKNTAVCFSPDLVYNMMDGLKHRAPKKERTMSEINMKEFIGNASGIAERVGRDGKPVMISGEGFCDLVLMTRAEYEDRCETARFFDKLCGTLEERMTEAQETRKIVSHETVLAKAKGIIGEGRMAHV
jgi:PHD/YefM family antitoxin component YafN of YafNO toxin-antitoxin module